MSFRPERESSIQHIWGSEAIEARAGGMRSAADEKAAQAILDWYQAMGVDEAVGEVPFDSFAASQPKPAPRRAPEVKMAPVRRARHLELQSQPRRVASGPKSPR
jgi:hypothetical protein